MRRFLAALSAALSFVAPASAQTNVIGGDMWGDAKVHAASYTGPGDVVSGATAFYGLRAFDAAYAASGGNAIEVRNTGTNETCNVPVTSTGGLGNVTGCSESSSGDTLATFCTEDSQTNCAIVTWYDQTGNGYNATQSTSASQPSLILSCAIGTNLLPCVDFTSSTGFTVSLPTTAQPLSFANVRNPTGTSCSPCYTLNGPSTLFISDNTSSRQVRIGADSSASSSSDLSVGTGYAIQALFNGASSEVDVNGTISSGLSVGTNGLAATSYLGWSSTNDGSTAYWGEFGIWPSNTSSSWSSLTSNERTYWGF